MELKYFNLEGEQIHKSGSIVAATLPGLFDLEPIENLVSVLLVRLQVDWGELWMVHGVGELLRFHAEGPVAHIMGALFSNNRSGAGLLIWKIICGVELHARLIRPDLQDTATGRMDDLSYLGDALCQFSTIDHEAVVISLDGSVFELPETVTDEHRQPQIVDSIIDIQQLSGGNLRLIGIHNLIGRYLHSVLR